MYEIGQVAKITGLTQHTLRAWEKRHNIQPTSRSASGRRIYDAEAVQRLKLLKRCTELGCSIATAAQLSADELQQYVDDAAGQLTASAPAKQPPALTLMLLNIAPHRMALAPIKDHPLATILTNTEHQSLQDIVETIKSSPEQIQENGCSHYAVAACIENLLPPVVTACAELKALGVPVMLCYHFCQRTERTALEKLGVKLYKAPLQGAWLASFLDSHPCAQAFFSQRAGAALGQSAQHSAHRFSAEELMQILEQPPNINCECPNHLSEIILKLNAFERYSAQCPSRDAEDEKLHQHINRTTAYARSILETLLNDVLTQEGITITQRPPSTQTEKP